MATVPTIDNFSVNVAQAPTGRFRAEVPPDQAARMLREQGEGLVRGGEAVARATIEATREANQIRINDAMNQAVESKLRRTYDPKMGFVHLRGADALTRPSGKPLESEAIDGLKADLDEIEKGLGNTAQKLTFRQQANQLLEQYRGSVQSHVAQQFAEYSVGVQQGTIRTAIDQMGLAWGDPTALAQSRNAIRAAVTEEGRLRGWSGQQVEAATTEQLSRGHAAVVMSATTSGRTQYAADYLKVYGQEMDATTRVKLQEQVRQVADVERGDTAAEAIWAAKGPKDVNDAVNIFDMEAAVRSQFKGDPTAMKAGIDAIRQRAQAWDQQQRELNASNVNTVFGLIDGGTSLAKVRRSPAWLALPETKQHEILKALESEALAREQRGYYREGMELQRLQRAEKLALLKNGAAYLAYSDPEALAGMSRTEIAALRPILGLEATEHLLAKKDALEKPAGKIEARMDTEDFNQVAGEMGIDPFKKNATAEDKARLGSLKFRIEQLINAAQVQKKGALTRDEKMALVREEMARTVTIDPGMFSSNKQVPVIALDQKDIDKVVVPAAERKQIIEALRQKYKANPNNPNFAPTDANVRRLYIRGRSRAGDLLAPSAPQGMPMLDDIKGDGGSFLDKTGKAVGNAGAALGTSVYQTASDLWGVGLAAGENIDAGVAAVTGVKGSMDWANGFFYNMQQYMGKRAALMRPKADGIVSAGIYSGFESLGRNLLALPLAFTPGGQGAALTALVTPVAGGAYNQARGYQDYVFPEKVPADAAATIKKNLKSMGLPDDAEAVQEVYVQFLASHGFKPGKKVSDK